MTGATSVATLESVPGKRRNFRALPAGNPNHFGNLATSPLAPVLSIQANTTFEEIGCVGFPPQSRRLDAGLGRGTQHAYTRVATPPVARVHTVRGVQDQAAAQVAPLLDPDKSAAIREPAALTAIGGATGHCYRFDRPTVRLPVHPRDMTGLLSIPTLRRATEA